MADTPTDRYFAVYVQARRPVGAARTERRQWILLPRISTQDSYLYFERAQENENHRSRWKHGGHRSPRGPEAIVSGETVVNYEATGWEFDRPVVARISEFELKQLMLKPKTPYFLLERFEKQASKFGYKI